ncbi:discoidin domain-containing protein [Paenibacillus harenae]|uniref:discoidin domain-containing protein n=1 Tax=Paenibacillus harenae TaxID=306543 RepID=UPI000428A3FF|nr:discoidin domain-containing protein [Paenibacillus harenae]
MKSKTAFHFRDQWRRLMAVVVTVTMFATLAPAGAVSAVESGDGGAISTGYTVEINETVTNGFTHPGVGVTKAILENMRTQVLAQKEPWYSYYKAMTVSATASKTVTSSNQSSTDPTKPAVYAFDSQGFNSRYIADGLKAYTQSLMYYITGDEVYRANAMHIIRIWSQMDPAQYKYFNDAHIHTGIPLNRMVTAAEILRYSSYQTEELKWTDKDTADFTNNLITPAIETFMHENSHFMNQHNYPLLGAMAGYIFTDNRERYNEAVEWATVNKTATNQGFNGSIKQLFRLVDTNAETGEVLDTPVVQHVEMGRDQAHGAGDLTNSAILSRMFLAQGTKVDPVEGTVSTQDNAVGYYEFLDDRFLAATDFFWKYMLGYDASWVPTPFSITQDGTVKGIYYKFSDSYRGRTNTAQFWDMYYYYTYVKGINVAEKAPYFYEAFTKRIPSNYYYQGSLRQAWESPDGGADFWIYIPEEAESEGAKYLPKEQSSAALVEIEDRYTAFDHNTATMQEGADSYVEFNATAEGSNIVIQNLSYANRTNSRLIGLKFRTDGPATVELSKEIASTPYHKLTLPDTNGEWKYITYDMGISHVTYGQLDADYSLLYMSVKGEGTTVDVDHLNVKAGEQLTPPVFNAGAADLNIYAYVGAPITLDLSAADSGSTDTVSYGSSNLPDGADLNANTGAFSWRSTQSGTFSFIAEASDGTTLAAKNVHIVVSDDRTSAVEAATAVYDSNKSYVAASLNKFNAVYDETMSQIATASDEAFYQQLLRLRSAALSLQLLTPSLSDGSMDYTGIVKSTFGDSISLLVDGNDNTFPVFTLAQYPSLFHILDFGADYKVTADAFSFEGRMNFVDRMAGTTVFGSNDGETWTRITPEQTAYTDGVSPIEVDDAYKNMPFRFIKMEMIDPQPDALRSAVQNLFELAEFRIYGERHEIDNKLESVSIGSDQSINGKIEIGHTATLTIKAKEAIQNVQVKIQGKNATVSTEDNINWTAVATLDGDVQTGPVKFAIDYKKNDGTNGETTYLTTDSSKLYLVDPANYLDVPMLAKVTASDVQYPGSGLSKEQVGYLLFDGNSATYGDLNTGSGSYYTVNFGADASIKPSEILLMPRADQAGRMNGLIVQGSNDNVHWTSLTTAVKGSKASAWTVLKTDEDSDYYRYVRLYNGSSWFGNVAEVEFYGEYRSSAVNLASKITSVEAPEEDAASLSLPAVPKGYTIAIKSAAPAGIIGTNGAIAKPAVNTFVSVVFTVTKTADGTTADTGSILTLVPGETTAGKIDVSYLAAVKASAKQFPGTGLSEEQVGYLLFDGNTATYGDLNTGSGSYYTIDFGANASVRLSGINLMPRTGQSGRLNGLIVQGSNDNSNWTNLTQAVIGAQDNKWIELRSNKILNQQAFRYLRLYNSSTWFGNVAEVEFYGNYDFTAVPKVIAPDSYTKASYYLYLNEIERINVAVSQPGADKAALLEDLHQAEQLLVSVNTIYPKIAVTSSMALASSISIDSKYDAMITGWRAFDGDTNTFPDTKTAAGWARIDLGEGNVKVISGIRFMPRTGYASRMNGALIQGSNDGTNFDTFFTISGISDVKWHTKSIDSSKAYRYLRYYSPNGFTNVGELEFYEKSVDRTLLALLLDKASAVAADHYTDGSYAALQTAVTNANSLAADANATQTAVDAAAGSLLTSLNGLIYSIEASVDPATSNGTNGWYTVPVTVTLSTYGSAVYKLNDEDSWHSYTTPITLDEEGAYTVSYRSKNSAGIAGAVQTVAVNIDKAAPISTAFISPVVPDVSNGWHTTDITVSLAVSDNLSGVAKTEYQVNDGPWLTYSDSIPAFGDGIYTINYRSTDLAGNLEQFKTVEFKVDKTAPELSVQLDQTMIWPANHKMGTVNATLYADDAGSVVESVILTSITCNQPDTGLGDIEAAIGTEATSFNLRAEKDRIYTITYTATDKAGNKKIVSVTVTVPHDLS